MFRKTYQKRKTRNALQANAKVLEEAATADRQVADHLKFDEAQKIVLEWQLRQIILLEFAGL